MIRRPPRSTQSRSSAASDVYKRQLPALGLQGRPELFCFGLSQVSAFLQQGRALRQAPASVDEDLRLMDPSLLIPVESPDPAVVAINQPALSHDHAASTLVLATVGLAGQVVFRIRPRPKKREQAPQPTPSVTHGKHHCFRDALSKAMALWWVSIRTLLGITA